MTLAMTTKPNITAEDAVAIGPGSRVENALEAALATAGGKGCPPRLAAALRYAVFPGGARVRPRLCLAVAVACAEDRPAFTDRVAAAIEMLHCASLVHDDLPCFDNAPMRRGKPSVHRAHGERLAVLVGDALIVMAFEALAVPEAVHGGRLAELLGIVGAAVGAPAGIAAGQAWECESQVSLSDYQRSKTGALFSAATMAGAAAAGHAREPWRLLGERLGEAYQVADDLCDVNADPEDIGKPVGRDAALGRPNAVQELGLGSATERLRGLVGEAIASIPPCEGEAELRSVIELESQRFLQAALSRRAA